MKVWIGKEITVIYDPRPFFDKKVFKAEVVKLTKTGFRVRNLEQPGLYEDELFKNDGTVRGWNTLTWF